MNVLWLEINQNQIKFVGGSKADDSHNGNLILFYEALKSPLEIFELNIDNELLIYYDSGLKHLIWRRE